MSLFGAIEAGGTKFVCAVASGPNDIKSEVRIPTESPEKTFSAVLGYFQSYQAQKNEKIRALGIGSFGPLDLNLNSETYGHITTTPKNGWSNIDIAGFFRRELDIPVGIDTDVNAAAYAEALWGAGKGFDVVLYLTVGTGIGGGLYVHGRPLHGLSHPEMGHVIISQDKEVDSFEGCCPYHQNCLEGLASGRAVDLRWHCHASELPDDHKAWDLEADYLAQGLVCYLLTASPERIVLGGGLMHKEMLYPLIREKVLEKLGGYISVKSICDEIENYIVSPGLKTRSGICGAIALAMDAQNS